MKAKDIIAEVNEMRENRVSTKTKLAWLFALEQKIVMEVLSNFEEPATIYPVEKETELQVPEAYHKLYVAHLCAEIDYANGEIEQYNNDVQIFENEWTAYMAYLGRTRIAKKRYQFNAL